jgi:hypothetical protein
LCRENKMTQRWWLTTAMKKHARYLRLSGLARLRCIFSPYWHQWTLK